MQAPFIVFLALFALLLLCYTVAPIITGDSHLLETMRRRTHSFLYEKEKTE
jgi:hypothetical protein